MYAKDNQGNYQPLTHLIQVPQYIIHWILPYIMDPVDISIYWGSDEKQNLMLVFVFYLSSASPGNILSNIGKTLILGGIIFFLGGLITPLPSPEPPNIWIILHIL